MNVRLLPLLAICASALLALKLLGFVIGPNSESIPVNGAVAQESDSADAIEVPPTLEESAAMSSSSADVDVPDSMEIGGSAAERAVLQSLGRRRESLDAHEGELDLREKLLKATEERVQKRVEELKKLEQEIESKVEQKETQEKDEIAGLVTMYENMKAKDAARIFDRLSLPVLLKVVRQMNPRKMAAILAKMSPEAAEKLTVAIASDSLPVEDARTAEAPTQSILPKIPSN